MSEPGKGKDLPAGYTCHLKDKVRELEAKLAVYEQQTADIFTIAYFDGAGERKDHMQVLKDGVRDLMAERDLLKKALLEVECMVEVKITPLDKLGEFDQYILAVVQEALAKAKAEQEVAQAEKS